MVNKEIREMANKQSIVITDKMFKDIDKKFEKMSKGTADKMNGSHPRPKSKKSSKKK